MDYSSLLTDEQKKSILEQRIAQFASEAYQHTINKTVASTTGNEEGVTQAEAALGTLEATISIHQDELAKLAPTE